MLNQKPLVTVYVPLFNRKTLIVEALQSVLAQTYSPLEIIICDDCSTDGSIDVVKNIVSHYQGPHRVLIQVNENNLGLIGNINQVFRLARGELIVINCDDDRSMPNRVEMLVAQWLKYDRRPFVIYSSFRHIAKDGTPLTWAVPQIKNGLAEGGVVDYFRQSQIIGCTAAYRPELMTVFGPICQREAHDDYVLFLRGRLLGDILAINSPLLDYRDGGVSSSLGTVEAIWLKPFRAWLASYKQIQHDLTSGPYSLSNPENVGEKIACVNRLILEYQARIDLVSGTLWKRLEAFYYLADCPGGQPKTLLLFLAIMPRSLVKRLINLYYAIFKKKGH